jgi:hypothetical protein
MRPIVLSLLLAVVHLSGCARHPTYGVPRQPPAGRSDTSQAEPKYDPPPQ